MNDKIREPFYSILFKSSEGYNWWWKDVNPEALEAFADQIVKECTSVSTSKVLEVITDEGYSVNICSVCGSPVSHNYCSDCGSKLIWSEKL